MYLLGYIQRDARIYLCDKDVTVTSFALSLAVAEYQTLVLRGDMDAAAELFPSIPGAEHNKLARFLEGQGHKDLALEIATDPEHKFDLALALGHLDIALEQAREADSEHKWKTVGDAALTGWDVKLAAECFSNAKDLGSLLLLYSSTGDRDGLRKLSQMAKEAGQHNVSFSCLWQLADVDACIQLLVDTNRAAEAVLLAQTYKPSKAPEVVKLWKKELEGQKKGRVAKIIGVPGEDEELFPEWDEYIRLEETGGPQEENLIDVEVAEEQEAESPEAAEEIEVDEEEAQEEVAEAVETE
jgi:coatomer subunit beta'